MLIRLIKQNVPMDSFLEWLHCLVLMDDTVIIATSRQSLLQKLTYLEKYCNEYGMIMNQKKTKLLVVNGDEQDRLPIQLGEVTIHNAQSYVYLGAVVTEDGSTALLPPSKSMRKIKSIISTSCLSFWPPTTTHHFTLSEKFSTLHSRLPYCTAWKVG